MIPKILMFRVSEETSERADRVKLFYGWSRSQLLRFALDSFLESAEKFIKDKTTEKGAS